MTQVYNDWPAALLQVKFEIGKFKSRNLSIINQNCFGFHRYAVKR
jgi:hypothetical protein